MAKMLRSHAGAGIDLSAVPPGLLRGGGREPRQHGEAAARPSTSTRPTTRTLNAIFRCAHSIKGGAATFGFHDVAEADAPDGDAARQAAPPRARADARTWSTCCCGGRRAARAARAPPGRAPAPEVDTSSCCASGSGPAWPASAAPAVAAPVPRRRAAAGPAAPARGRLRRAAGRRTSQPCGPVCRARRPGHARAAGASRRGSPTGTGRVLVTTAGDDDDLRPVRLRRRSGERCAIDACRRARRQRLSDDAGFGFLDDAPGPAGHGRRPGYGFFDDAARAATGGRAERRRRPAPAGGERRQRRPQRRRPRAWPRSRPRAAESSTPRGSVEKVDQLINLVGELVITQAMLAQNGRGSTRSLHQQLAAGLADLERNTRDLQESVMSIRMIPMSVVFNRFPRMLRDLAGKLGKKVELVTEGEAHRARQGPDREDHRPADPPGAQQLRPRHRAARGAPGGGQARPGTITLARLPPGRLHRHRGARRRQGPVPRQDPAPRRASAACRVRDAMSDQEVWQLIFAPGFSTAEVVTDVSGPRRRHGRGQEEHHRARRPVEIDSAEGCGMRVSVRLPLTLAIMDGMSVGVRRGALHPAARLGGRVVPGAARGASRPSAAPAAWSRCATSTCRWSTLERGLRACRARRERGSRRSW